MNEISAAAGTDNQRQRATPATTTSTSPAGNANQPPRPTRRRRSRRRRGRSASTGTGAGNPAEQPVVAAPPTRRLRRSTGGGAPRAHLGPRGRADRRPAGRAHGQARHPDSARAGPGLQGGDAHRLDSRPPRRDPGAPGHLPGATRRRLLLRYDAVAAGWSTDADQSAPLAPGCRATEPRRRPQARAARRVTVRRPLLRRLAGVERFGYPWQWRSFTPDPLTGHLRCSAHARAKGIGVLELTVVVGTLLTGVAPVAQGPGCSPEERFQR